MPAASLGRRIFCQWTVAAEISRTGPADSIKLNSSLAMAKPCAVKRKSRRSRTGDEISTDSECDGIMQTVINDDQGRHPKGAYPLRLQDSVNNKPPVQIDRIQNLK